MRTFSLFVVAVLLMSPVITSAQTPVSPDGASLPIAELYVGGPDMPVIISSDYADPDSWYAPREATFSWVLPDGTTAVAADLFTESGKEPMTSYRPPITSITIDPEDLTEGTNYLTVQFRNEEKWGMYAERPIRIDATAPEPFSIDVQQFEGPENGALVSFETRDALSGISHYEIKLDGEPPILVSVDEARHGHIIDISETGDHTIKVTAFDRAGNSREETLAVMGVVSGRTGTDNVIELAANDPGSVLAAVMAAVMLLMFGYMVYERQRYAKNLTDLRQETGDIQTQLLRIFSALREEIHDQIRGITKKSRLSKGEKSAVEGLNKALSLSESLIEREIKDVKNILG